MSCSCGDSRPRLSCRTTSGSRGAIDIAVELRSTGQPGMAIPTWVVELASGPASSSKIKGRRKAAALETTAEDINTSRISGNAGRESGGDPFVSLFIRLLKFCSSPSRLSRETAAPKLKSLDQRDFRPFLTAKTKFPGASQHAIVRNGLASGLGRTLGHPAKS